MGESSPGGSPPLAAPEDRLDSWKEIAAYLRRDVTTVQRWEKREGMPVHRHVHDKLGSVYAFTTELDTWTRNRTPPRALGPEPGIPPETDRASAPDSSPPSKAVPGRATRIVDDRRVWLLAAGVFLAIGATWWAQWNEVFWADPVGKAVFRNLTDFGGVEQAAAISRDGRFVAFLSNREGTTDVVVTQVGTGQFYNLTRGRTPELINTSVRVLGFTPDGASVTFWSRGTTADKARINIWAVPTLGGVARPYVEGGAELDWAPDGSRLVFHTPAAGDPMFVADVADLSTRRPLFTAPAGLHAHFPLWSPDGDFIYFVQGMVPDAMDIWRIRSTGGPAERITSHNARVTHPVFAQRNTLMYLATASDGSGPWLYSLDVRHRIPHRLDAGPGRYTSLSASADGRTLVATVMKSARTLWRLSLDESATDDEAPEPISLTTAPGSSPRMGPGYLLYVSSKGAGDALWKLADGAAVELWSAPEARIVGGPDIAPDGRRVAFTATERGKTVLRLVNADGTDARTVTESLALSGDPAWAPDGQSIVSAVSTGKAPHMFRISLDGTAAALVDEYSVDPAWSADGAILAYSGADIGTAFEVHAADASGRQHRSVLTLPRGARRLRFIDGHHLLVMRGELEHKDLWLVDLDTNAERQVTRLPPDFELVDFDVSRDGRELVLERVQERADIVLIDRVPAE